MGILVAAAIACGYQEHTAKLINGKWISDAYYAMCLNLVNVKRYVGAMLLLGWLNLWLGRIIIAAFTVLAFAVLYWQYQEAGLNF